MKTTEELRVQKMEANYTEALRLIGEAGNILEQMQEFWRHGTPIHPGSDLVNEFADRGKRVMIGPMRHTPNSVDAAHELLAACKSALFYLRDRAPEEYAKAIAAIAKAEGRA